MFVYVSLFAFVFSTLLVKIKSKKERLRSGQMLVEGWRLIVDGLEANCHLKYVIFSRTEELARIRPFLPKTGVVLYKVPYKEIELFSDVETAPGIFGEFFINYKCTYLHLYLLIPTT